MHAPIPPALQAPWPETPGQCCGWNIKVYEISRQGYRMGLVAVVCHIVAFLVGYVPFFYVNREWIAGDREAMSATMRGADLGMGLGIVISTVLFWLLGFGAAVLLLNPGGCCAERDGMSARGRTSCRMCAVIGLATFAAVLHCFFFLIELIAFPHLPWTIALLVVKNLLCTGSEILCTIVACSAKNAVALDLLKNPNGHPAYMLTQPAPMPAPMAVSQAPQVVPVAMPISPPINHGAGFIGQR